ncbi:hypothetical protein BGZ50_006890 [Haplosporangium sp. Z 11]|nr:hypothetical protein BGZ50_006890 [Haplosporangium sp. Z 11]
MNASDANQINILRLAEMDASDKDSHSISDYKGEGNREDDSLSDANEGEEHASEANDEDSTHVSNDDTTVGADDIKRMEHRKACFESNHHKSVQTAMRDALFSDPYILGTAEECGIAEDQIMTRDDKGRMVFYLKASYFDDWKSRHQISIDTDFTPHGSPRAYSTKVSRSSSQRMKDRAGQIKTRFDCHRRGVKYEAKGRQRGGKSGKPAPTSDGKPGNIYRVEYFYQHNHRLGDKGNIGTQQKSKAIMERIKAMLLRGMSISAIMHQLTMEHAAFTRFMEDDGGQRLSRDQFIAYDDVYNILYALTAKEMWKSDDPVTSAKLWMEDLKSQDYFTYYDSDHGLYHGFSSPWQLNELRRWGDVFCFDGMRHASGLDTYLFSIVVKNRETGYGVPVAFFLTKSQQANVLEGWLRQLKIKMDSLCNREFRPTAVITDQGQNEINAIRAVYPNDVRIFYCAWHVLQA